MWTFVLCPSPYSFPQATLLENSLLLRTANVHRQFMSIFLHQMEAIVYIFLCHVEAIVSVNYPVNIFATCTALKIGDYCLDIRSYIPKF